MAKRKGKKRSGPKKAKVIEVERAGGTLLLGDGYAAPIWSGLMTKAGVDYESIQDAFDESLGEAVPEILIETEDSGLAGLFGFTQELADQISDHIPPEEFEDEEFDLHANRYSLATSTLASSAQLILLPCYRDSPTNVAASLDQRAALAVGYTVFPPLGIEKNGASIIELGRAMQTSNAAWSRALAFAEGAGLQPQCVGDAPGLVFARTLACLINEAALALSEGIASAQDIDAAMRLGVNYPMGLLEWADEWGIDMVVAILQGLYDHFKEDRYRPCPLLRQMAIAHRIFHEKDDEMERT